MKGSTVPNSDNQCLSGVQGTTLIPHTEQTCIGHDAHQNSAMCGDFVAVKYAKRVRGFGGLSLRARFVKVELGLGELLRTV